MSARRLEGEADLEREPLLLYWLCTSILSLSLSLCVDFVLRFPSRPEVTLSGWLELKIRLLTFCLCLSVSVSLFLFVCLSVSLPPHPPPPLKVHSAVVLLKLVWHWLLRHSGSVLKQPLPFCVQNCDLLKVVCWNGSSLSSHLRQQLKIRSVLSLLSHIIVSAVDDCQ